MLYNIQKAAKKSNRFFELIPKTVEPAFILFSPSSVMEVLENGQLKTFEMYKSAKHKLFFLFEHIYHQSY